MNFTLDAKAAADALARASCIVASKITIPILGNVLIRAEDDAVTLTTNNLEMAITERLAASVKAAGAITAPADLLARLAAKMPPDTQLVVHLDGDHLHIRGGRAQFKLQTLPLEDFPVLDPPVEPKRFTVSVANLQSMIAKVEWAISDEQTRYYLCGIYLCASQDKLVAVATNGVALARYMIALSVEFPGIIIPTAAISAIKKMLGRRKDDEDVAIEVSPTLIKLATGGTTLTSKLVGGTYPDYERVIPSTLKQQVRVSTTDLDAALDRVATLTSASQPRVKLCANGSSLTLSTVARAENIGSATEQIDAASNGGEMELGFNPRFAAQILAQVDAQETDLQFNSAFEPILILDGDATFVLMPMRV